MSTQGIDLKKEINAKKQELNWKIKNGIGKETLRKSQELDELIVKYMTMNEKRI